MKQHVICVSLLLAATMTSGCHARATVRALPPPPALAAPATWDEPAAQRAAESLVADCVSRPWAQRFLAERGRLPVIRVYPVRNHAVHVASAQAYTKEVEMALVRSGRALVAGAYVDGVARAELDDQQLHASDATVKRHRPLTSDFVLSGWIVSERREDAARPAQVITLQLIAVQSNQKVWMSSRRI